ncbi:hypothetical protein CK203_086150 [Vitis vinifera]|uniref:Uncharacterized protein n=1 Tax=Vitis vinifera TaxID=29760 RepID=A0A438CTB0_VITVI|nr:hypothetical protein CK203_086150 [Vitis vinifera]
MKASTNTDTPKTSKLIAHGLLYVSFNDLQLWRSFCLLHHLLYVHGEKFNQPIFFCNNVSGLVEPVVPENQHRALYSTHSFKILFKEGGCGTFVPLFFNLITSVRRYNELAGSGPELQVDPLQRHRLQYVDPNDPTRIFLQQPTPESQLRRRTYHPVEDSI